MLCSRGRYKEIQDAHCWNTHRVQVAPQSAQHWLTLADVCHDNLTQVTCKWQMLQSDGRYLDNTSLYTLTRSAQPMLQGRPPAPPAAGPQASPALMTHAIRIEKLGMQHGRSRCPLWRSFNGDTSQASHICAAAAAVTAAVQREGVNVKGRLLCKWLVSTSPAYFVPHHRLPGL